jgi:hypothetical protein
MNRTRISIVGLMAFCAALVLLGLPRPAKPSIEELSQVANIAILVYVGTTPAPTAPPSPEAGGSETINVNLAGNTPQFIQPLNPSLTFAGNAGQTVTETCAEELWVETLTDASTIDIAMPTAFKNLSGSGSMPTTALQWEISPNPYHTPAATYTPPVDLATDGGVPAQMTGAYGPSQTLCVNIEVKIPTGTATGVYYGSLTLPFYTPEFGSPTTIPSASPTPTPTPNYIYSAPFIGSQNYLYAYSVGSNGNAAPVATITSTDTLANPMDVTTAPNGDVIVANEGYQDLLVLSPFPSGSVTPIATITNNLFDFPDAVGTDSSGNIYVLQGSSNNWATAAIMKFPSNANGNVSAESELPSNLNGVATSTGSLSNPADIAITPSGTIYSTSDYDNGTSYSGEILAFATNANGATATPIATIAGASTDLGALPCSVAVDPLSNIYVLTRDDTGPCPIINTSGPGPTNIRIVVFPANSNGNVAPSAVISGSNTMLSNPIKIRVDSSGGIYVADLGVGGILYFAPGSNGNVAPEYVISGSNTGLGVNNIQFIGL